MEEIHQDFPGTKLWTRKPTSEEKSKTPAFKLFLRCPCCRTFVAVSGDIDSQNIASIYVSEHVNKNQKESCHGSGKSFLQFKEWMEDKQDSDLEKVTGYKYIWYIRLKMDEPSTWTIPRPVNNNQKP